MTPNHPPLIIGLTGYAGVGKDTARLILEHCGYIGFAFADPIRTMLRELFLMHSISTEYMDSRALKESTIPGIDVSYRQLAQTLGTEWGRKALHEDIWVKLAEYHVGTLARQHGARPGLRFVVSDVRFANEAAWVKSHGGEIWRIERNGTAPVRAHASETGMADLVADRTISNNGTVEMLRLEIAYILAGFAEVAQ